MVSAANTAGVPTPSAVADGPAWAVARRFPPQGGWDDADYFELDDAYPRFELVDRTPAELSTPTELHQDLMEWLVGKLKAHLGRHHARTPGYKLRIRDRIPRRRNDYRFPDVIASADRRGFGKQLTTTADLVVKVLSPGVSNRDRDLREKRADYAEAGVPEYWIVDAEAETPTQLRLAGAAYEEVGVFGVGDSVASTAIPDFAVDLAEMFDGVAEG